MNRSKEKNPSQPSFAQGYGRARPPFAKGGVRASPFSAGGGSVLWRRKWGLRGISSKKFLGQHFLVCDWVTDRTLESANLNKNDTVLEIGPGKGALTFALAQAAGRVVAVEKDENLARQLQSELREKQIHNVSVITRDIRTLFKNPDNQLDRYGIADGKYKVVANIPYYLTGYLFRLLLGQGPRPHEMTVMVQKEVARRIAAKPPDMNLLALCVQSYGNVTTVASVPAQCFKPKPNVDSEVIKVTKISDRFFQDHTCNERLFFDIIKQAFSGKRKFLINTLSRNYTKELLLAVFSEVGIPSQARPQELSLEEWGRLVARLRSIVSSQT